MTAVSLVIPTLNAGPLLEEVLAAVDDQPGAGALERLAFDSRSDDATRDVLHRHGFRVEVIERSEFDHGATRDAMIEATNGEVVLLLTQDATPADANWLAALVDCYRDPKVGAAYCRQIPRPDCNPFIARRIAEWTAGKTEPVVQECASPAAFAELEPMQRLQTCAYDNVAGSVRRAAWQRHRFGRRPFGEDVAFGKSLILDGWRILFEPRSAVIHSHNRSAREEGRRIYCDHQNLRDLFELCLLPDWHHYRGSVEWGQQEYARIVDALDLPAAEKQSLRSWAIDYAHHAALGMYLGAHSARNMTGPFSERFRALDAAMHRGI